MSKNPQSDREARLAAALRTNLRRRKLTDKAPDNGRAEGDRPEHAPVKGD